MMRRRGDVYLSLPWASIQEPPPVLPGLTAVRRKVDLRLSRARARLQNFLGGMQVLASGRRDGTIVICHAGMETVVAGLAHRLLARRARLVAVDFLLPPSAPRRLLRLALRGIDEFVVIRSGDVLVLGRLGVEADRCRFVAFPAPRRDEPEEPSEDYVYAGGIAQRDWGTLARALARSGTPAVVACPEPSQEFSGNVQAIGLVSPESGRAHLRRCRFFVQAIHDNDQPSGPLLILDAFSAGKPVVASDVNGTKDYVRNGVNGVLVPPGDSEALADAVARLYSDADAIARMSANARKSALELTAERFWSDLLQPYLNVAIGVPEVR